MNFAFSDEQQAITELAQQIFADRSTPERVAELAASDDNFDRELWAELGRANLLGVAVPQEWGGMGQGIFELCLLLEEQGRRIAPIPILPSLVLAALPIAHFGSDEQKKRDLPGVADGSCVLSAGLSELGSSDPTRPGVSARADGVLWRLEGVKVCVPYASDATRFLVTATSSHGPGLFLIDPADSGVALEREETTNLEPSFRLTLNGARGEALGDPRAGGASVEWLRDRALAALAALQLGVASEALRRTAEYTTERKQFGRPIGSFQGVALRAADAYIDLEAMRSTLWQAAWRLSVDLPAAAETAVAKWWACRGGGRIAHTAQHLHGGIGADVDYPIHRYFLWSKQIELNLGGAGFQLARLGEIIARGDLEGTGS